MCYVLFFYRSKEQTYYYYLLVLLCIEHYQKEKEKTEACRDQIASLITVSLQIKMILHRNVLDWQLLGESTST